jgi:uncharacterized membrane protein
VTVNATAANGFNSTIALAAASLPLGVTASYSPSSLAAPGTGSSTLTLNATPTARVGTYNARITAAGGGLSATLPLTITLAPPPNFVLSGSAKSVTAPQGGSAAVTFSIAVSGGFNSAVAFAVSGLAAGITPTFSPATLTAPGTGTSILTLSVDPSTSAGTQVATITATGGGVTKTLPVTVAVTLPPNFTLTPSTGAASVTQGLNTSVVLTVTGQGPFNSPVALSVAGLPAGVTATFSILNVLGSGTHNSTMKLTAAQGATTGPATLTITGAGGGITRTATVSLNVAARGH